MKSEFKKQIENYRILFSTSLFLINKFKKTDPYNKKYRTIIKLALKQYRIFKGSFENYCIYNIENLISYLRKSATKINQLKDEELIKEVQNGIYKEMDTTIENLKNFKLS